MSIVYGDNKGRTFEQGDLVKYLRGTWRILFVEPAEYSLTLVYGLCAPDQYNERWARLQETGSKWLSEEWAEERNLALIERAPNLDEAKAWLAKHRGVIPAGIFTVLQGGLTNL